MIRKLRGAKRGAALLFAVFAPQDPTAEPRPSEESVRSFYALLDRYRDERLAGGPTLEETAARLREKARAFSREFALEAPLELVRRLESFSEEALRADRDAAALLAESETAFRARRLDEAAERAGAAIVLTRGTDNPNRRGAAASLLARIDSERGAFAEAARDLEEAVEAFRALRSRHAERDALADLAQARARAGITDWRGPLERALEGAGKDAGASAKILLRRGWLELAEGNRRPALGDFRLALETLQGSDEGTVTAESLLGIAEVHLAEGEADLAREVLAEAERASQGDALRAAAAQVRARLALAEGDPARASRLVEALLSPPPEDPALAATALVLAGVAAARAGDAPRGARLLEEAAAVAAGRFPRIEGAAFYDRGALAREMGDPSRAIECFERAILLAARTGNEEVRAHALAGSSAALLALGDLDGAIERGTSAVVAFEARIEESATARGRDLLFAGGARDAFEASIRALLSRRGAGDVERAFELAERSRARSLLDEMRTLGIDPLADLPPTLRGRRAELVARYRLLCASLEENLSPAAAERLRARLDETLEAWSALAADIAATAGGAPRLPAPARVEAVLRYSRETGTCLLLYFLGREASALFVESSAGVRAFSLPPRKEIEARVSVFLDALRGSALVPQARDRISALAASLAGILLPDGALSDGRRISVIADGILEELPLECLLEAGDDPPRAVVGYAPSCATLLEMERRAKARAGSRDPVLVAGADLESLPFVAEEVAAAAASFSGRDVVRLEGAACRKETILERREPLSLLHLALHGRAGPTRVGVEFFSEDGGEILWPHEVFALPSVPDLVVLSGCSTGRGERIEAAGVLGLAHAFVLAGASRIVVSLWPVDDEAAARTMRRFYEEISRGRSPAEALSLAREALRRDPRTRLPFYWAPFVLVGPP